MASGSEQILIAVMGPTGTGKSTFVNLVSGSQFQTGTSLISCTPVVQATTPFDCYGRLVTLIDTPGFDDTVKSDSEILDAIASYLAQSYRGNHRLAGVIYMHRISDFRMGGISRRNFSMFRSLCGDNALGNVVVVTNMWGEVTPDVGQARERELSTNPSFFKPVLDKGAKMLRHYNNLESASNILRTFIDKYPVTLQIQNEMVNQGKPTNQTTAGAQIEAEINRVREEQRRIYEEKLRKEREQAEIQQRADEERSRREVEEARAAYEAQLARQREEQAREAARQAELRRQETLRIVELQRQLQAQEEARRAHEAEVARMQAALAEQRRREEEERARIQRALEEQQRAQAEAAARQSEWVRTRNKVRRELRRIF